MKKSLLLSMILAVSTVCFSCSGKSEAPPKIDNQEKISFVEPIQNYDLQAAPASLEFVTLKQVLAEGNTTSSTVYEFNEEGFYKHFPSVNDEGFYKETPQINDTGFYKKDTSQAIQFADSYRTLYSPKDDGFTVYQIELPKQENVYEVNENGDWPDRNSYHK